MYCVYAQDVRVLMNFAKDVKFLMNYAAVCWNCNMVYYSRNCSVFWYYAVLYVNNEYYVIT